jgi:predicted ATPase/DNA-binding CsgD family transcriptional regulator
VQGRFTDGVCFIDLATLTDPQGLALTLATALGLRQTAGLPAEALLSRHLAAWQGLLLLDNCEHLIGACAALVARLLDLAPRLQVLATSRESLGLPGEQVVAMRPMRLPIGPACADLLGVEAVELFVSQALLVAPDFELTLANAQTVVEICQRLDGIPLALELAAARVGLLTVEQIRDRLADRFRLLTRASKSPSRHQTLLATLQWSHDQLGVAEQRLLAGLCVFSGGCTLAALLSVAGTGDELAVADLLRQLVDKSLVMADRPANGEPRYRLLETVRHFVRDQLQAGGGADALRARHLSYFVDFTQTQDREFAGPGVKRAVARLDAERGNLLAAQAWCAQAADGTDQGLDLANAQRRHWIVTGHYLQGRLSLGQALARAPQALRSSRRGLALFGLGQLCLFSGQFGQASQHAEQALAIGRELGDLGLLVIALDLDRALRQRRCDLAGARRSCHEALAIAQTLDDPYLLAIALLALGAQQREEGDYPAALLAFQHSRVLLKRIGNLTNIAIPARDLAALYTLTGELALARAALAETIALTPLSGSNHRAEQTLRVAARLAAMVGDGPLAARIQGALDQYSEAIGAVEVATEPQMAAMVDPPRSLLGDQAYALHHQAGRRLSLDAVTAEILVWLKDPAQQAFVEAVDAVRVGAICLPVPGGETLSPRESQVLDLVARGFTYAEIAQHLGRSLSTVQSHARAIYAKLGVHNRTEAVFEARQLGLLC